MRIAIVVDNPRRDLPGSVLLAMHLCRRGADCYLVPMYFGNWGARELCSLAPDFVLLNYLRRNNDYDVRCLSEAGISVGVLDTEGIMPGVMEDFESRILSPDLTARHAVARYFTWGTKVAELSRSRGWFPEDRVLVTGVPRFDFYARPWREAALRFSRYADEYPRPLVLINTNFKANPRFQTLEEETRQLIEVNGFDREFVRHWLDTDRQSLFGIVELANGLAARFPHVTFIFRPHPFEKLETYRELLEKRDNLHLTTEGTAEGWILRASAVIQRSCTTALEATLAGVPSLRPAWLPSSPAVAMPPAEEVSLQLETDEQLTETLAGILAAKGSSPAFARPRTEAVIGEWLYRDDGHSAERVARGILDYLSTADCRPHLRTCRDRAYGLNLQSNSWKARMRMAVAETLGLSVHWSFRRWKRLTDDLSWWHQSGKYFGAPQVQSLAATIQECVAAAQPDALGEVGVAPAAEGGDYHFGYRQGVSVKIFPKAGRRAGRNGSDLLTTPARRPNTSAEAERSTVGL